jgi:hypothetical protein
VVEEALPGAESGERERCTFDMREAPRLGREHVRRDDRVGRDAVPVERRQREDLVVRSEATRVGSDRDDYPG